MIPASEPSPSFASVFNGLQDRTQCIEQLEKSSNDRRIGGEFAIAQLAEQVFARMRKLLQPLKPQEAGRSLDGVNRPEDIGRSMRHRLDVLPDRSGSAPSCPALPGFQSGIPSSARPLHRRLRADQPSQHGISHWLYRSDGAELESGHPPIPQRRRYTGSAVID